MKIYDSIADTNLISLITESDEYAFEVLYSRYAKILYRYARMQISSGEDCEEIIQEIFESLWSRRHKLNHVTEVNPYLYRMVKFKVIRYYQREAIVNRFAEHYKLFEAVYNTPAELENTSDRVEVLLSKGLADLPERCQEAMRLRIKENLSNSDIAKRMNIGKGTVENYIIKALNHLRSNLDKLPGIG